MFPIRYFCIPLRIPFSSNLTSHNFLFCPFSFDILWLYLFIYIMPLMRLFHFTLCSRSVRARKRCIFASSTHWCRWLHILFTRCECCFGKRSQWRNQRHQNKSRRKGNTHTHTHAEVVAFYLDTFSILSHSVSCISSLLISVILKNTSIFCFSPRLTSVRNSIFILLYYYSLLQL